LVRDASGNAISNENPSFVAGSEGGCGSASAGSFVAGAGDFVSVIAVLVTAGGSQVLLRLSLLRLIRVIAELQSLLPFRVLWDRLQAGKAPAESRPRQRER